MAANVAHSLQQSVLYVDSNGGLTACRLLELLQALTSDEEEQVRTRGMCFFMVVTWVNPLTISADYIWVIG